MKITLCPDAIQDKIDYSCQEGQPMKVILENIGFTLIGLGGGVLLANQSGQQYLGWILLVTGILFVIFAKAYEYLWRIIAAPIDDWEYTYHSISLSTFSDYPEKVFLEDKREAYWESVNQNVGDSYRLDLRKERLISAVHFIHGDTNKVPAKWQMFLYDHFQNLVSPYKENRAPHIDGSETILVQFEKAVKAQYILVRICETRKEPPFTWAIESIRIKEKRLLGLWNAIIGELKK